MLPGDFDWEQLEFEWDRHNQPKLEQEGHYHKRGRPPVYPHEAEEVFYNFHLVKGPKLVGHEQRYVIMGTTDGGRLWFGVFVIKQGRAPNVPLVRIISSRPMEAHEASMYNKALMEAEDDDQEA